MIQRKSSGRALLAMLAAMGGALSPERATAASTWANAGSDWFDPANWIGGTPSLIDAASLPATAIATSPNLGSGTATANSLSINNSGGAAYSLSPGVVNGTTTGTLMLGTGGLIATGGGTSTLNIAMRLSAPTGIDVGANTRAILTGNMYGAAGALTKSGDGTLQLDQVSDATGMLTTINGGVLEVRNALSLGTAANIVVNSGGVLQIDPTLRYTSGVPSTGTMVFGDGIPSNQLTLKNGSTLRSNGVTFSKRVYLDGRLAIENGAAVNIGVPTNGDFALIFSPHNTVGTIGPSGSQITVTGAGVFYVNGTSGLSDSYTGSWVFNHGIASGVIGQTYINDYSALGVSTTGYAAPVSVISGYLTDAGSDINHPVPNPMTINGGVLNSNASGPRVNSYFSGAMTFSTGGISTIDMSSTSVANLAGPVCSITLSGQVSGNGTMFITAPTTVPLAPAVLTLSNTSSVNPNSQAGNLIVQWNAVLAAATSNGNSNPLGAATITLAGGALKLSHPGTGSNGVINAFAGNNIVMHGYANGDLVSAPGSGGTITLDSAGSGTGNTIVLNRLTFETAPTYTNQTLAVANAGSANYSVRFDGEVTLAGSATITTGANPADVIFNNKVTGSGNLTKSGNNTLTLSGASSDYSGSTTVNGGTLVFNATHRINALTVSNARAVVSSGGNKFLKATALSITGTGALDLTDEDAILTATSLSTVKGFIATGFAGGAWTGNGITSSQAALIAANQFNQHKTALGYAAASQIGAGSFNGETVSGANVLIRYTLAGDANLDGIVNSADFTAVASSFNATGKTWAEGDFDYDGVVNAVDFNAVATNFGGSQAGPIVAGAAIVPEPGTALLACLLVMRRHRRHWEENAS